jgi:hypothetical protein
LRDRIDAQERLTDWDEAAERVAAHWIASGQRLLRIEGFTKVGKSTLSNRLFRRLGAKQLGTDMFADNRTGKGQTYLEMLNLKRLRTRAADLIADPMTRLLIFEGVCLEETLPSEEFGRGFRVYVKRASKYSDLWHDFYDDIPEEKNRLRNSILQYHKLFAPDRAADLIIAVPEGRD